MLETIITSSVLITVLLLLRTVLKRRVSSRLRYGLWLIAAVRLMLPLPMQQSPISVMNLLAHEESPYVSGNIPSEGNFSVKTLPDENTVPANGAEFSYNAVIPDNSDAPESSVIYNNSDAPDNSELHGNPEKNAGSAPNAIAAYEQKTPDTSGISEYPTVSEPDINTDYINTENGSTQPTDTTNHNSRPVSKKKLITMIWAAGAIVGLLWFSGVNLIFYLKLKKSRIEIPCASPLPVYRTDILKAPCLFGNAIYINECPENRLKYIIAHEYSHYRHGDTLWAAVRGILLCIYWFDPPVWAAAVISKRDCECACDEAAMELIGEENRLEYGKALIEMIPRKSGYMGVASTSMTSRGNALKERLRLIAEKPLNKRSAQFIAANISAVIVLTLACGCTFTAAQNPPIEADNGIAVTPESPAAPQDERQYHVRRSTDAYFTYTHNYDNYKSFYDNNAKAVYADSLTVNPEEFEEFSAFFNLWIEYRNKTKETVRINYSPEDEKFYADEPFAVSYIPDYIPDYLKLLPDKSYEDIFTDSWEEYVKHHYPCDMYDEPVMNEPVLNVWIAPLTYTDSKSIAWAGFVAESENYIYAYNLSSFEDGHGGYTWDLQTGSVYTIKKAPDRDYAAEGYTLAQTREEYYSRQKYRPGDVLHSFKKQVPLSDGSGIVTRTVQLVMTREDYKGDLPNLNYELHGSFALRILDSEGNITGECPIDTAAVDVNGNTTVTVSNMYLSKYFKFSKNTDRLLVFSVPNGGYHDDGWHFYTAFFGITDEGEIFPYHIDSGEFDYPAYMGGNELFTGELYGNSRLYSESGAMVNKGEHYLVNLERQRNNETVLNIILFDETAHLIKNAYTLTGYYDEELLKGARDVTYEKYNYLFFRHIDDTRGETPADPDFNNFENIVFEGDGWQDYVNMPMGEITDRDLFYALSAEAEERHPGVEDMIPFWEHGSKEYVVHFYSDCMGETWEYAADAVMTKKTEDGIYYVYFISFGCDYYSVCRYRAEEQNGKWLLTDFEAVPLN